MHSVTADRLIFVAGIVSAALFFITWEPLFGVVAFVLLVIIAPWLNVDATGTRAPRGKG
jgi:hypothetical protein